MSIEATEAVWAVAPSLKEWLTQAFHDDPKRKPSVRDALLVALRLAEMYRNHRGYVDETGPQLQKALPFIKDVRPALDALHDLGIWVRTGGGHGGGRKRRGTRRRPGPRLELDGVDPAENSEELGGVEDGTRRGSDPNSAGYGMNSAGSDPATPPFSPVPPPSSSPSASTSASTSASDAEDSDPGGGGRGSPSAGEPNPAADLDAILYRAALLITGHRERAGAGVAGPGAIQAAQVQAGEHAEVALGWLAEGHEAEAVAQAVARRVTGDPDAEPRGEECPACHDEGFCDPGGCPTCGMVDVPCLEATEEGGP